MTTEESSVAAKSSRDATSAENAALSEPRGVKLPAWAVPALIIGAIAAVAVDMALGRTAKFALLEMPGFYALFGAAIGVVIVCGAVVLGSVLKRKEGYYDVE